MKLEKSSKGAEMSEAAEVHELIFELTLPARLCGEGKKGQINCAHREVAKLSNRWTWRRVKSFIYQEVPDEAVKARELRELRTATLALREARKAHAEFTAETDRLAAIHFPQDEDFYRAEIEARRSVVGGMGRSRTGVGR